MKILNDAQEAIATLQEMIDSGKHDDLKIMIVQSEDSVVIIEREKGPKLTGPADVKGFNADTAERDQLDDFINTIEDYLNGILYDGGGVRRPSARVVQVTIPMGDVFYANDNCLSEDALNVFKEEMPHIIQLYEALGWKIEYDDNYKNGTMVFTGNVPPSPYRKLLESQALNR